MTALPLLPSNDFKLHLPDGGCTADVLLDVVLAGQLGHVVDDLVVEV